jgi:hypothetical protein
MAKPSVSSRTLSEEEVDLSEYIEYTDAHRQGGSFLGDEYLVTQPD